MGDAPAGSTHHMESGSRRDQGMSKFTSAHSQMPFYSQLNDVTMNPPRAGASAQYGTTFDMSSLHNALNLRPTYDLVDHQDGLGSSSLHRQPQSLQYGGQRIPSMDQDMQRQAAQQFFPQQFTVSQHGGRRQPSLNIHLQHQYPRMDGYGYGPNASPYSPVALPFGPPRFAAGHGKQDYGRPPHRASEPAPVPSFPRGPPRKPKQSGHALWVGNLPPAANVTDLKDHFSRDATKDIESLFLISKSNCAFVNYRTEAACIAAMNRFHDSRFHGVRLVCRLRRGSTTSLLSTKSEDDLASPSASTDIPESPAGVLLPQTSESPVIVGHPPAAWTPETIEHEIATPLSASNTKVPEKYFIIKSLTVQDLEASVRNGTWATQSHNEKALTRAYGEAENVYLVFSANKSGEYFGYARMASAISGEPVNLGAAAETDEAKTSGTPQSIPTPASEHAPKGRIIDDSARGTIFWEADNSDAERESPVTDSVDVRSGQHWGRQFKVEWVSTTRLPFFRTRGLRNPWNANREVKIARDGTELEPSMGRRLITMFHRPTPPIQGPQMLSHTDAYAHPTMPWSPWAGRNDGVGYWQQANA